MIRWFFLAVLPTWIIAILCGLGAAYLFTGLPTALYYLCTIPVGIIPCIMYYEKIIKTHFVIGVDKAPGHR